MAFIEKLWFIQSIVGLVIFNLKPLASGKPQVPCYFIFGDSEYDNGNNNDLNTTAKANYSPYGIDFPEGPTGRFTNGRNNADFIAELLGFDTYVPPFANVKGRDITKGVNYASGAAGILDETGRHLGDLISFNQQLQNHGRVISRIVPLIGNTTATKEYLAKCLYTVALGNNDYINNYLLPQYYPTSSTYTPKQYAEILVQQYSQQLWSLYRLGARKIAVFGIGSLGCIPAELSTYGTKGSACVDFINNEVQLFNDKLKPLVDELNTELGDAKFIYVNVTTSNSSTLAEITIANAPCCNVSITFGDGQCIPEQIPCFNRSQYYFWDDFHPTEIVNQAFSRSAYFALAPLLDDYPFGTGSLAELNTGDKVEIQ